jgi:hypothetical protein
MYQLSSSLMGLLVGVLEISLETGAVLKGISQKLGRLKSDRYI